mgnify:CR=1 FL=1
MLFSHITLAEKYNYLSESFKAAFEWLRENDANNLADGAYKIVGDDVIANVQSYETEPAEKRKLEAHDKYFDIQFIAKGKEMFGVCEREGLKLKEAKPEKDIYFYEEPEFLGFVLLDEGDLIIVEPEEAHKPRCAAGKPEQVKKVVVKVKI